MRRFWAYIITVVTSLLAIGALFTGVLLNTASNYEYQYGHEMTFRVADKNDDVELIDDTAVKNIAEVMDERLKTADITAYEIRTVGFDTIKVSLSETKSSHYEMISKYLTFNASLALTTDKDEIALMSDFKTSDKAYVNSPDNSAPQIVIPVNTESPSFRAVIEAAKEEAKNSSEAASEDEEETKTYVYLWYDFNEETDSYEASKDDPTIAEKILIPFDIDQYNIDSETGKWDEKLVATVGIDSSEENPATIEDVQEAYYRAHYYVNLVNASELDYKVTYMYSRTVDSLVEDLFILGSTGISLALNRTLLAFIIGGALIMVFMAFTFGLASLSGLVTTAVSAFGALTLMSLFGIQLNIASIIGLAAVIIVSVTSSSIYLYKFKEEAYKGRSIKKANSEAMKKALLPVVDVNVVSIVIGALVYLIAGKTFVGLAASLVLGGVLSLVMNTLALRGLMYLVTNTTSFIGKYNLFGIKPEQVPNIVGDEKQKYYGEFSQVNPIKKKKPVTIISAVMLVASLAALIVFGATNKGNFYNTRTNVTENSEIYFESVDVEHAFSKQSIQNYLDKVLYVNEDGTVSEKALSANVSEILEPDTMSETVVEGDHTVTYVHYYYVAVLNIHLNEETLFANGYNYSGIQVHGTLDEVLDNIISLDDLDTTKCTASLKSVTNVTEDKPGFVWITLATAIGTLILSAYFMLRYRLSRGLTALAITSGVGLATMGFFSLIRVHVSTYMLAALPIVAILAFVLEILVMSKEKELLIEDRSKELDEVRRDEIATNANSTSLNYALYAMGSAFFMALTMFGFGPDKSVSHYTFIMVGMLFSIIAVFVLFVPLSKVFKNLFSKIKIERKPRKKAKKAIVKKSAEPEEAIFIGIND